MVNNTIVLNKSSVEGLIEMSEVIDCVETAFAEEARCNVDMLQKNIYTLTRIVKKVLEILG